MRLRCFGRQLTCTGPTCHGFVGVIWSNWVGATCVAVVVLVGAARVGAMRWDRAEAGCALSRARLAIAARAPIPRLRAGLHRPATCWPTHLAAEAPAETGTLQL